VIRERRRNAELVSLEEMERTLTDAATAPEFGRGTALRDVRQLILQLKPLDRQIILCYLEEMDAASIAEITGLSPANVAMKIHRIKKLLSERIRKERTHA
jgi:RNA polymerase sigma-70 factor, ECF subfamily